MNSQNLLNDRENCLDWKIHTRFFENAIAVVPECLGVDLFVARKVIPDVSDIPSISSKLSIRRGAKESESEEFARRTVLRSKVSVAPCVTLGVKDVRKSAV